ncbi:hypothetical protein KDK95_21985 [Actinospica sp. MGRD01-02]|uniref:Uncharacterized protein n=1 Tax=Actinospica acidithermotolerans TaxID=2828514 RepID=A0A941EJZ0_9ACTN|nr:hypothetical protein [Actinospica acidithermotolerans]
MADSSGDTGSASTSFTTAGTLYYPTDVARILDTRKGIGASVAKVPAGGTLRLKVVGAADGPNTLPSGISAVALNLTAVNGTAGGYITAYADDSAVPGVSNLNYGTAPVANTVIAQVGSDGYVDLRNTSGHAGSSVDLVADIEGFYTTSLTEGEPYGYTPVAPTRLLDTRNGTGAAKAKVGAYKSVTLNVTGQIGDVLFTQTNSAAVVAHVTVTNTASAGFITSYPGGAKLPTASTLNFTAGQTISNTVIVPIENGAIQLYNGSPGTADLIVDVTGYYTATGYTYVPITPTRLIDTRTTQPVSWGSELAVPTASADADLAGAEALAANLTATEPTSGGNLGAGSTGWETSSVNFGVGQTVANFTQISTSPTEFPVYDGQTSGHVEVIADVYGYFADTFED